MRKFLKWFKDISITKKINFTAGLMIGLIAVQLAVLIFSIDTLTSIRAFVKAEGLWSNAYKDAIFEIINYSRTHDERDFERFQNYLQVVKGDKDALEEMLKEYPDIASLRNGLVSGRNHTDDIDGMLRLYRRFKGSWVAVNIMKTWSLANSQAMVLTGIGIEMRNSINSSKPSQDTINRVVDRIPPINENLTILGDKVSFTLGEVSRWMSGIVLRLLIFITVTVAVTGLLIARIVSKRIQKGIRELLEVAQTVAKGDLTRKAKVSSKDEIGVLGSAFNQMIDDLKLNIAENEQALRDSLNILMKK